MCSDGTQPGVHPISCQPITRTIAVSVALLSLVSTAYSDAPRYEVGLRGNVLLGDGVPANDILGFGVTGRYYLRDGWFAGLVLDTYDYDFERPSDVVGI